MKGEEILPRHSAWDESWKLWQRAKNYNVPPKRSSRRKQKRMEKIR